MGPSEPTPGSDGIRSRVDGQQKTLDLISSDILSRVSARTDYQEAALQSVYRPLVKYAQLLVDRQRSLLDPVVDIVVSYVRGRVNGNTAALTGITDALGTGVPDTSGTPMVPRNPTQPGPDSGPGLLPCEGPGWKCGCPIPPPPPNYHVEFLHCPEFPEGSWSYVPNWKHRTDEPVNTGDCPSCGGGPPQCPPPLHYDPTTGQCVPDLPPPPPPPPGNGDGTCPGICPVCTPPDGPLPCGPVSDIGSDPTKVIDGGYLMSSAEAWAIPGVVHPLNGGDYRVYIGQVPANPGSQRIAGPTALYGLLTSLKTSLPRTAVPRFFAPSGPATDPSDPNAVCPVLPKDCGPGGTPVCPDGQKWDEQQKKCVPCEGDNDPACKKDDKNKPECQTNPFDGLPLWDVDDPNFCDNIDGWVTAFQNLGDQIYQTLLDSVQGIFTVADMVKTVGSIPVVGDLLKLLFGFVTGPSEVIYQTTCLINNYRDSGFTRQAAAETSLGVIKTLLRALDDFECGIDIPITLLFTTPVTVEKLEEIIDRLIDYVGPANIPRCDAVAELYARNFLDENTAYCYCECHGESWYWTKQRLISTREQLTAQEYVRVGWRVNDTNGWVDQSLKGLGFMFDDDIATFKAAQVEPPTPSDLLTFATREVFRPDKLGVEFMQEEFNYEAGLRDLFFIGGIQPIQFQAQDWSQLQAAEEIQGKLPIVYQELGQGWFSFDTPLAEWLAHYIEISPEQSAEGLHKLRPNRVQRFRRLIPGHTAEEMSRVVPFADYEDDPVAGGVWITPRPWTSYEHARLLRQKEYNPIERGLLETISYHTLGLRQLKSMYASGTFGEPQGRDGFVFDEENKPVANLEAEIELMERYQDMALSPEDAQLAAYDAAATWEDTANNKDNARLEKEICTGYQEGVIDRQTAAEYLKPLLKKDDKVERYLTMCDVDRVLKLYLSAQNLVGKLYRRGEADENEARQLLQQYGIQQFRVDELINQWQLQMAADSKQETAAQICQWRKQQLIGDAEAMGRLTRIGYTQERAEKIMQSCYMGILAEDAKNLEKLRKEQEKDDRKRRAGETEGNIRNWIRTGIISSDQAASMLAQKGWLPQDIEAWIAHSLTLIGKDRQGQVKERRAYAKEVASAGETNVKKYLTMGIVNESQARQMLAAQGWNTTDIDLWMKAYNPPKTAK